MRPLTFMLCILLLSATSSSLCWAATAVSPAHLENTEGALASSNPWPSASRGMSIYDSSMFEAGPAGAVRITSFNLRPDGRHAVGARFGFDNLKLLFAITPVEPLAILDVFDTNIANASTVPVTVFDDEWIVEAIHPDPPGDDTRPFDFKVPLTSPFVFNPADGNLLVDWIFGSPIPDQATFDRDDFSTDQGTRWASGVDPIRGAEIFTVVTQFEYEAIPEPSAIILACTAVVCLRARKRPRR